MHIDMYAYSNTLLGVTVQGVYMLLISAEPLKYILSVTIKWEYEIYCKDWGAEAFAVSKITHHSSLYFHRTVHATYILLWLMFHVKY